LKTFPAPNGHAGTQDDLFGAGRGLPHVSGILDGF